MHYVVYGSKQMNRTFLISHIRNAYSSPSATVTLSSAGNTLQHDHLHNRPSSPSLHSALSFPPIFQLLCGFVLHGIIREGRKKREGEGIGEMPEVWEGKRKRERKIKKTKREGWKLWGWGEGGRGMDGRKGWSGQQREKELKTRMGERERGYRRKGKRSEGKKRWDREREGRWEMRNEKEKDKERRRGEL